MASAPTISFSGLASGLDTTSIITQLTNTAQIPVTRLNTQISGYNAQLADWQALNSNLAALQSSVKTLSNQATTNIPTGASTTPAAATIATQVGATLGSHTLSISQLAQAQEVVSASVSSSTTALGKSGSFTLNGKTVQVNATDALSDVAAKINGAGAGVSANVVAVGTGDYRLTLTSSQTGTANGISASDTGGTVLKDLGVIAAGPAGLRQAISYTQGATTYTGAASLTLASATQPVGTLLGIAAGSAPSGTFHLTNGGTGAGNEADVAVDLNTDSLASIANTINKAGVSGVSAEVVTVPDAYGNLNRVHQLRIVSSGSTQPTPSTATSAIPSYTAGVTTYGGSLTVDGQNVALSGNSNSVAQIQAAIQATTGNSGITATISGSNLVLTDPAGNPITATLTSLNSYASLVNRGSFANPAIANGSPAKPAATAFTDTNGALSTLGVLQNAYTKTVVAAQDAKFNLDGLDLTRGTNVVSDIIPSATVTLLSGTATAPATTTLNVTQNTQSVVQAVNAFANAYNAVQSFITNENTFTPPTGGAGAVSKSPALFGSPALTQIQQTLSQALTAVSGKNTLGSIGVSLDQHNSLTVDTAALTTALQADPNAVANLFGLSGTSDSASVQFVRGGAKSVSSAGVGYGVTLTQAAAQAKGTAGVATGGGASTASETLTFSGTLFPSTTTLTVPTGSTLKQTADLINATSSLNTQIYATIDATNHLVLSSQGYGSSGTSFSVASDRAAGASNSGVGPSLAVTTGKDVAGTINGEAAFGSGRTLTGNAGNKYTDGIQLLVTATAVPPAGGSAGHVTLTHGVADGLGSALSQILDPTIGSVSGAEGAINSQITAAQKQIGEIQVTVDTYKAYLTKLFSDTETRISKLQAQGSAFTAAFGANSNNGSSGNGVGKASGG